jgi:methylenetetrahydrofolate reductase (NADPH)
VSQVTRTGTATDDCPKAMTFGPCGGARHDGSCEVDARPCPFLGAHTVPPVNAAVPGVPLALATPCVIVDVRAPAGWRGDHERLWRATGHALQGCIALLGEHVDNPARHDDSGALAPTRVITILREAGLDVIATVTGRDRSLAEAAHLIGAYRDAGALAVHCVTGDHPAAVGIDRPTRFGAESMTLIAAAVDAAVPATVGESPASPGRRSERVAAKQTAGAALCILNHAGDAEDLIAFADACHAADATLPLIAPVPMVADRHAALALAAFPGLRLPHGFLDDIIGAGDPASAGLDASRRFVRRLADGGRFAGINLSGGAGGVDPWDRLRLTSMFIEHTRNELTITPTSGRDRHEP